MSDTLSAQKPSGSEDAAKAGNDTVSAKMPPTNFDLASARANATAEGDRNEVFTSLVTGDTDIVGLVAYSIYKQNKHDWLVSFNKQKAREPNEDELYSYIVGESTPRRLAIYRHLAEATLDGRGPKVTVGPATEKFVQRSLANAQSAQASSGGGSNTMAWVIALIVAAAAVLLAGKYGIPGLR